MDKIDNCKHRGIFPQSHTPPSQHESTLCTCVESELALALILVLSSSCVIWLWLCLLQSRRTGTVSSFPTNLPASRRAFKLDKASPAQRERQRERGQHRLHYAPRSSARRSAVIETRGSQTVMIKMSMVFISFSHSGTAVGCVHVFKFRKHEADEALINK